MGYVTVWTKQNSAVLEQLKSSGRFMAKESCILADMEDTADIMLFAYDWLAKRLSERIAPPPGARYPVWLSLSKEATMIKEPGYAILELYVEAERIRLIDAAKWTRILNYQYLPLDDEDMREHSEYMSSIGISDSEAVLRNFYPAQKQLIVDSWDRLFDGGGTVCADGRDVAAKYGLIWEVKTEDVRNVY